MGKIITVTLNPAIDQVMEVSNFEVGRTASVINSYYYPAGKGVNVARALACLGTPATAIGLVGEMDEEFFNTIQNDKLMTDWATSKTPTRNNVTICDVENNTETHLRNTIPSTETFPTTAIIDKLHSHCLRDDIVVFSGSQPEHAPEDALYKLCMEGKKIGATVMVDCSGPAMKKALEASPYMIKPNMDELEEMTGRILDSEESIVQAMKDVAMQYDIKVVVVSMGKEGALMLDKEADKLYRGRAQANKDNFMPHAVGSGDAMVAGFCAELQQTRNTVKALKKGIACGTANLYTDIPGFLMPEEVDEVMADATIEEL